MTVTNDDQEAGRVRRVSRVVRVLRIAYVLVAVCFVGAVAVQVYLAGAGVLVHPRYVTAHTALGHVMHFFPLGLIVLGLAGRLAWRLIGLTTVTLLLFVLQYVFLWVMPRFGMPELRALHAVNALALFWLALYLAQQVWRVRHGPRHAARPGPALTT